MLFTELVAILPLCEVNQSITASGELNSVNMALYDHATFIIQFASTLAFGVGASAPIISIESATSDAGDTADVTFHWKISTGSAATVSSAMTYGADNTSSALSNATAGDWAGHTLILEVDGDELRSTSLGKVYNWLTVDYTNATTGTIAAYAILANPRYESASMPIAI